MRLAPNSALLTFRFCRQRWPAQETKRLHRWSGLEVFLAVAQEAIDRERGSGADPPDYRTIQAWLIGWVLDYASSRRATLPSTATLGTLWFVLASHLEAARNPVSVYELDDEARAYGRWIFPDGDWSDEDRELGARESISLYLYERGGWGPDWFRPMIEE